jgi:predicted nucleotidyltransferase
MRERFCYTPDSMAAIASLEPVRVGVPLPMEKIADFCRKWQVIEFALFGSVLRDDFRADSDVDVLVTFHNAARPSLFDLGGMALELEDILHRRVDLLERRGLEQNDNPYLRPEILRTARVIYAR